MEIKALHPQHGEVTITGTSRRTEAPPKDDLTGVATMFWLNAGTDVLVQFTRDSDGAKSDHWLSCWPEVQPALLAAGMP
jgi:hypothetical protein